MSGPKTVTPPQEESKATGGDKQPCSPIAVCCEKIREAAYHKWEAAGCPCGDGVEFWLQAEAELTAGAQPDGAASKR
jgi:hypothetical protein